MLADDANRCPEYVSGVRSDAPNYLPVQLAGDLEMSMRLPSFRHFADYDRNYVKQQDVWGEGNIRH